MKSRSALAPLRPATVTVTTPAREIIEELIIAREIELAKTSAAVQRQRIEADLTFLRDELARLDGEAEPGAGLCDTATQHKRYPR